MWKSADSIGIFSILAIFSKKSVFRQKKSVDMYEVDMWILGFYWAFLLLANRIIIRILNCINQR